VRDIVLAVKEYPPPERVFRGHREGVMPLGVNDFMGEYNRDFRRLSAKSLRDFNDTKWRWSARLSLYQ
jgi:hypothetical protein